MADALQSRVKTFLSWRGPDDGGPEETDGAALVGKGNYGQVFRSGGGAVVKVVFGVRKSSSAAKLAYREHVMSLLQTVLVLRGHSPHFPMHYGFGASSSPDASAAQPVVASISRPLLCMRLYIEAFDCSMDAAPPWCLARPRDWAALMFQVMSAVVCVACLLDVCHNDLYPRNVLLRCPSRAPGGTGYCLKYDHFGVEHEICWHSLAAVTDFGVCSSPLLSSKLGPEVKRVPAVPRGIVPFGSQPPLLHVLNHTYLPPFSRDPYVLFKWGAFRTKGLPQAPPPTVRWCQKVLKYLDDNESKFKRAGGSLALLKFAFSPESLADAGLLGHHCSSCPKSRHANGCCFSVHAPDRAGVLADATALLSSVPFETTARSPASLDVADSEVKKDDDLCRHAAVVEQRS